MSALLWLPMRSRYVDPGSGLMVTENLGSLGGTVQCGDGATAGTFPTQRSPRGASFDGGDWIDLGMTDALERTQPWSFGVIWHHQLAATEVLWSSVDNVAARGIEVFTNIAHTVGVRLMNAFPGNRVDVVTTNGIGVGLHCLFVTYDGSSTAAGVRVYVDGSQQALTVNADTLSGSVLGGSSFLLGAKHNGAGYVLYLTTSGLWFPCVFPYVLTPTQVSDLSDRMRLEANT